MELNFINLKALTGLNPQYSKSPLQFPFAILNKNEEKDNADNGINPNSTETPEPAGLSQISGDAGRLLAFAIKEIFDIHSQASQTVWDIKMFAEELKRDGSGFIACYANGGRDGGTGKTDDKSLIYNENLEPGLEPKIIGFFIFYTVLDEMHILDITIAKNEQSKGVGSFIMAHILKKYIEAGIKYFYLEVRVSNVKAIKLYKKFGFKIFMLRKEYYEDNKEDALCMVKKTD